MHLIVPPKSPMLAALTNTPCERRGVCNLKRLVWFRNDLRVHDNEALSTAAADPGAEVSCLYVYDVRWDELTPEGDPRCGPFRKRYVAESVIDLRASLRKLGLDLICAYGNPTDVVPAFCAENEIEEVYHAAYATHDERSQDRLIEKRLNATNVRLRAFQTHTLLHPDDFPDVDFTRSRGYSKLRKMAEAAWAVRPPQDVISVSKAPRPDHAMNTGLVPWVPEDHVRTTRGDRGIRIDGGETAALARTKAYFWDADRLRVYKDSRNGLLDLDDSSKFSAPLSLGCVSARYLYAEVRRYERERIANGSTLWFLYELLWRDHFHFLALGRGAGLFTDRVKFLPKPKTPSQRRGSFERWRSGRTGRPFVDAAMIELSETGWMSNRMRQNVASYLVHDLGVDWQWGARWFESQLIDYDCASNWGNWSYVAGAGPMNTPHVFDVDQQANAYDRDGTFVEYWTGAGTSERL